MFLSRPLHAFAQNFAHQSPEDFSDGNRPDASILFPQHHEGNPAKGGGNLRRRFAPGENSQIVQGYLEASNVDVAEELIQLILAQRAYELNSKVIQAADEAMSVAANLRR